MAARSLSDVKGVLPTEHSYHTKSKNINNDIKNRFKKKVSTAGKFVHSNDLHS